MASMMFGTVCRLEVREVRPSLIESLPATVVLTTGAHSHGPSLGLSISNSDAHALVHELAGRATLDRLHEIARTKVLRAPLIIAVGVEPSPDPKVPEIEEVCAGAAAIQNMLLTAHELGLAAVWRTGDACAALEVKQFLHLTASSLILGFVYVGYPSAPAPSKSRRPSSDFTTWLGYPKSSEATNHAARV